MKIHTSRILTLSVVILSGIFVGKTFISHPMTSNQSMSGAMDSSSSTPVIDSMDSIIVAPDIKVYSETAEAIIVGTVEKNENNNANISISEVLKGDSGMKSMNLFVPNSQVEDAPIFVKGEYALFFICKNSAGEYLVCAGDAGKVLIDKDGNTKGAAAFTMTFAELKSKISDALKASIAK